MTIYIRIYNTIYVLRLAGFENFRNSSGDLEPSVSPDAMLVSARMYCTFYTPKCGNNLLANNKRRFVTTCSPSVTYCACDRNGRFISHPLNHTPILSTFHHPHQRVDHHSPKARVTAFEAPMPGLQYLLGYTSITLRSWCPPKFGAYRVTGLQRSR